MTPEEIISEGFLSVKEAAGFLRVGQTHLYAMMERGELAFCKLGRRRIIPRRALLELAAGSLRGGWAIESREAPA